MWNNPIEYIDSLKHLQTKEDYILMINNLKEQLEWKMDFVMSLWTDEQLKEMIAILEERMKNTCFPKEKKQDCLNLPF